MKPTVDYRELAPTIAEAVRAIEPASADTELAETLVEMVKLRISQMNGCAYCTDLHSRKLHRSSADTRKVATVATWEESPFFSERERAALQFAESLTDVAGQSVPEEVFTAIYEEFDESEAVDLVAVIVNINCWNRLWLAFGTPEVPPLLSS